jgi:uncharacterized protein (TIGR00251 family)
LLEITEHAASSSVVFAVRVQPRAHRDEIAGDMAGAIRIRLQAHAVDGRANEALIAFLAQLLNTRKGAVRILSGDRSRIKRIEIRGVTRLQIEELIQQQA